VSPETHPVALKINTIRRKKGLKALKIVQVECVLADDGLPIPARASERGDRCKRA